MLYYFLTGLLVVAGAICGYLMRGSDLELHCCLPTLPSISTSFSWTEQERRHSRVLADVENRRLVLETENGQLRRQLDEFQIQHHKLRRELEELKGHRDRQQVCRQGDFPHAEGPCCWQVGKAEKMVADLSVELKAVSVARDLMLANTRRAALRPFNLRGACPACGHTTAEVRSVTSSYWGDRPTVLSRTCARCQYGWHELPAGEEVSA